MQNADANGQALRLTETRMESNDSFTAETVAFWRKHNQCDLTEEDAREAVRNVVGFFTVLNAWRETMGGGEAERNETSSSTSEMRRES